jgi:hypothetical protein
MAGEWDESLPVDHTKIGDLPGEHRKITAKVETVLEKEHEALGDSNSGGEHSNGSAVCYEGTSTPTNRPDGSTALANNAVDRGRLWLDDNADPPTLKRWDGSAFETIGATIVQVVNTQNVTAGTGSTTMPYDDTIPQNTEGDEYMTLAITPKSATNKLKIDVVVACSVAMGAGTGYAVVGLFQDTTANALAAALEHSATDDLIVNIKFTHYMAAGTTSETTFKVRGGKGSAGAGGFGFNAIGDGTRKLGGVLASSITITEIRV